MKRTVFLVSDRTGITAETLAHSLLTQFEGISFEQINYPYLDTMGKAESLVERIGAAARDDGGPPLVFSTIIHAGIREYVRQAPGVFIDLFNTFLPVMEQALGVPAIKQAGRSHRVGDPMHYQARVDAINFTVNHDDGSTTRRYPEADVILIGVSRCGKTPTCLYLALHYGLRAANYPFTDDDLDAPHLPETLRPYRQKLFALTIDAQRLQRIRSERRPDSPYASMEQCRREVEAAERMFRAEGIVPLDVSTMSIEEIATTLLAQARIERRLYAEPAR